MESHGGDNPIDPVDGGETGVTSAPAPVPMPPIQGVLAADAFDTAETQPPAERPPDPDHLPYLIPAAELDPWGLETADATPTDPWGLSDPAAECDAPDSPEWGGEAPPEPPLAHPPTPIQARLFARRPDPTPVQDAVEFAHVTRDEQAQLIPAYADADPVPERAEEEFEEEDLDYAPTSGPRKGGGVLTIPLICIGVAVIACTTLLPLADDNHRQAWEREKLKQDLAHLKEQVRVNDEFLHRVSDDPTLAERLAQRQMKYIRQGSSVLPLRGAGNHEMSPFHLVAVPPPKPLPAYQPVGGALAVLARNPRAQLYASGAALLLIAAGLVLGYVPRPGD